MGETEEKISTERKKSRSAGLDSFESCFLR